MPQLKLETNLPVIFLTLLVIAIVVVGYLELKKINERIKVLEYLNEEKKTEDKKEVTTEKTEILLDDNEKNKMYVENPGSNNYVEQWQMDNDKENIIEKLNNRQEYMEENDDNNYLQGGVYGPPPTDNMERDISDEIIDKINNDENIDFESGVDIENNYYREGEINQSQEYDYDEDEKNNEQEQENDDNNFNEEDESDKISENKSNVSSEEVVNLKEIDDEGEFEKEKIYVDETFSVNQLKSICKNMGLQLSGNKTTLIKRIMDNQ